MNKPLDKISIHGFKSIRELNDFELDSLNILIGANGSGKTNFISLFKLLNQIIDENLQVYIAQSGGANSFLYFGHKNTEKISIQLAFKNNGYNFTLIPTFQDSLIFEYEEIWFHGGRQYKRPYSYNFGGGQKETKLHVESRDRSIKNMADHVISAIQSWRVYHFHDTSPSAKLKKFVDIDDNRILRPDASNLAAFLFLLKTKYPSDYKNIISTIRLVAPFFNDFVLIPKSSNNSKIQIEWLENGSDDYFNANTLSDGTLRFICLATLLLQPDMPATIIIDEPELGLHPYAITILAALLKSASEKAQVIVSTQSVSLVNQFAPENIIVVDRKDNQSTFTRYSTKKLEIWLEDYGMGDLWEKNLLGGRPA